MFKTDNKVATKVLFIGKKDDKYSKLNAAFIKDTFLNPVIVFSSRSEKYPEVLNDWHGDIIISYLAQWIIPETLLNNAKIGSINFHPGPPEYPGIGCTNFAIYNNETEFGVTCHHMQPKVDSGAIIALTRFRLMENDTVFSLTERCYEQINLLFRKVMNYFIENGSFPLTDETWRRRPYTRKQLNDLCLLSPKMTAEEIKKRLKATTFGDKIWAEVIVGEEKISYKTAVERGVLK